MALKIQYNKNALQDLTKQFRIRQTALPTIKHKESALRLEVQQARRRVKALDVQIKGALEEIDYMAALWSEFNPAILHIDTVEMDVKNIAGVKTPELGEIKFKQANLNSFHQPAWYFDGIAILKKLAYLVVELEFYNRKANLLDYTRKKTTQKVNLYEKVQIPWFKDAIKKIRQYLEDQEALAKASQKIVKNKKTLLEL